MRNLLIVDDERNIRTGLRTMIAREFADAYTFYFAEDGEEALGVLEQTAIDLIITDIRMPIMDGITLIHRLAERELRPDVIILSGYDDFQYAKAAIQYDAKDYLLKPIVRDELFSVLRRIESERQRKDEVAVELRSSLALKAEFAISQLGHVLLNGKLQPDEIRDLLQKAGLAWLDEGYRAIVARMTDCSHAPGRAEFMYRMDTIMAWLPEEPFIRLYDKDGRLIILTGSESAIERLSAHMKGFPSCGFQAGASKNQHGMEFIRTAYDQASESLAYSLLQSAPDVIRAEEVSDKDKGYKLPVEDVQKIANLLGLDREEELQRLLKHVLDVRTIMRYDIGYLVAVSRALNEHVFDKVFQVYGEESIEILRLYRSVGDINNFAQFHEYYHHAQSLLLLLNDYVKQVRSVHNDRSEIGRAITYMQEHFHEDLNMAVVSNHVSLNYSYFSQAFKDYTGETFVAYLRRLRLSKAKELLQSTELKVYEISAMSGFENVKHFTRVFKETEGISPLDYRAMGELLGKK